MGQTVARPAVRPHRPPEDIEIGDLLGRELVLDTGKEMVAGKGAGIDHDGALLVDTGKPSLFRVTAGSIVKAGSRERAA